MTPIHVLIVDSHALIRSGIQTFLRPCADIILAGEATHAAQATEQAARLQPEVILLDLELPDPQSATQAGAVPVIRALLRAAPRAHILALSPLYDEQALWNALEAGATGYLLNDFSPEELARSIRFAAGGHLVVPAQATSALVRGPSRGAPLPSAPLSERELQILTCLTRGWSNPQIARQLTLSRRTIKFHVSNILSKLGASSRTEAVARAVEYRLV